ncbi:kinase-like protein [Macrolepiota fuliginosa MF-IS2]|uniref:Kinase-like protein n=1 Tax=Macrolepiota fuliginosa MF-IS2 TaxID=1400762 RepID=A0A9P6BZB7_9AGAR|nr:kinase-like protein [Macrolepiota fuliginosa MF-IS2]
MPSVSLIPSKNDDGGQRPPSPPSCAMLVLHQKDSSESLERLPPHKLSQPHEVPTIPAATTMTASSSPVSEEPLPRHTSTPEPSEGEISDSEHPHKDDAVEPLLAQSQSQDVAASSSLVPKGNKRKFSEWNVGHPHGEEEREYKRGREEVEKQEAPKELANSISSISRSTSSTTSDSSTHVDTLSSAPTTPIGAMDVVGVAGVDRDILLPSRPSGSPASKHFSFPLPWTSSAATRTPDYCLEAEAPWPILPYRNPLDPRRWHEAYPVFFPSPPHDPSTPGTYSPAPPFPEPEIYTSSPQQGSQVPAGDNGGPSPSAHSPMPLLLDMISKIQDDERKTKAIKNLKGDDAQSVIDFLYSVLSRSQLSEKVEKYTWIMLYKLSRASELYPRCYTLKDIKPGRVEDGGGICDIYKGHHSGQELCLKVVRLFSAETREAALKSLGKEAILWSGFRHPNITPFYGVYYFESRERICLVSPWMDNGNLNTYLMRNPAVPRIPLIHDIISGLEYLHSKHVVHGDLKGANVLVNASQRACLADFGLSTICTNNTLPFVQTTNNNPGYTLRWAAPEILASSKQSKESDIWAFGSVCYEVLTRKMPYHECPVDTAVMFRILAEQPEQPEQHLPTRPKANATPGIDQISEEMWTLMKQCWNKKAGDRPKCSDIKRSLESDGLVERWDAAAHMERATKQRQQFENVMVERKDVPINLDEVERIFNAGLRKYGAARASIRVECISSIQASTDCC